MFQTNSNRSAQVQNQSDEQLAVSLEEDKNLRIVDTAKFFTKEAFVEIAKAGKLAFSFQDFYVTTLHLLYSLFDAPIIKNFNLPATSQLKNEILERIKTLPQPAFQSLVFFDPKFKEILIRAFILAKKCNSLRVDTPHLFLAALNSDLAADLKIKFGIDSEKIERSLKKEATIGLALSQETSFTTELTNQFTAQSFNLVGRTTEVSQILRIFGRQNKNNVLLIGEDGVGKDALVFGLAKLIATRQVPEALYELKILKVDLQGLLASSESFSKIGPKTLERIADLGRGIIFLNEVEFLTSPQQKQMLIAYVQLILKNSHCQIVISSKTSFWNDFLKTQPLINEHFETIRINEPQDAEILQILAQEGKKIENFHHVTIEKDVYPLVVDLAKRFLSNSFFPQKAISLLEESAALASLNREHSVTNRILKQVVADKTGVPVQDMTVTEKEKLVNLETEFKKFIIGQDQAVHAIAEAIKRSRAGLRDPKKPIGSFLFLGPTGVGKTETAKVLAKLFFNNEKAFVRLDMSEFSESHTVQRLVGSPPGYIGYEEGGQLTNPVLERPYSLILLDEIEKAHPKVFDVFLQVLDDGRLTDSQGRTADFKNTILIFTSNIGSEEILSKLQQFSREKINTEIPREELLPVLRQYFRPEFINRFDDIVVFNPLGVAELVQIAKLKIERIKENLKEKRIQLTVSDERLFVLVQAAYEPGFGARPIERMIREKIENKIANAIISGELKEGDNIKIN